MRRRRNCENAITVLAAVAFLLCGCQRAELSEPGSGKKLSEALHTEASALKDEFASSMQAGSVFSELYEVPLLYVVDGDTIKVQWEEEPCSVRLIGIDAPESVSPKQEENSTYGEEASAFLKDYLSETETVYLEFDEEKWDKYDRLLAYVWLTDTREDAENNLVNALVVKNGYAVSFEYPPNDRYTAVFDAMEQTARRIGAGLWQYGESTVWMR